RMLFSGYCEPINSWLPPVSPWALANSSEDIFNPEAAKALLKEKGYSWDISGRLLDPSGKPLPPLRLFSTVARVAPTSAALAELIADSLNAVGFPVEVEPMDFSAMMARLDRKDYSLAVLAWSLGKNPDSLYSFYHSEMDVDGGYNLTGTHDKALDEELSALRFAPDKAAAEAASTKAQRLLLDLMPSIPIYSRISVAAVSNKWKGIFTTDRVTADNFWTLLNAEPKDGKMRPLRMALADEPRNLNPFTASSAYAWQVLGLIYESMISNDPNTLENIPAIAESWQVTVNEDGAERHTELFFKIKRGLKWNDGSPLDARDIKASIDFIHKNKIPRYFDAVKDIRSVETPDNFTLRVNMDGVSYWYLDNVGGLPILPRKVIAKVKDWQTWNPLNPEGGDP
ncbi:MAG: ABC transporter substrate-binding protein, partial [Synergistes sp.]|nr:ABC transporter substrate-binding protein [Synergistes sp.]